MPADIPGDEILALIRAVALNYEHGRLHPLPSLHNFCKDIHKHLFFNTSGSYKSVFICGSRFQASVVLEIENLHDPYFGFLFVECSVLETILESQIDILSTGFSFIEDRCDLMFCEA